MGELYEGETHEWRQEYCELPRKALEIEPGEGFLSQPLLGGLRRVVRRAVIVVSMTSTDGRPLRMEELQDLRKGTG